MAGSDQPPINSAHFYSAWCFFQEKNLKCLAWCNAPMGRPSDSSEWGVLIADNTSALFISMHQAAMHKERVSWHRRNVQQRQISTPFIGSPASRSTDRSGLKWSLWSYCCCLEDESPRVHHVICFPSFALFPSYISFTLSLIKATQIYPVWITKRFVIAFPNTYFMFHCVVIIKAVVCVLILAVRRSGLLWRWMASRHVLPESQGVQFCATTLKWDLLSNHLNESYW